MSREVRNRRVTMRVVTFGVEGSGGQSGSRRLADLGGRAPLTSLAQRRKTTEESRRESAPGTETERMKHRSRSSGYRGWLGMASGGCVRERRAARGRFCGRTLFFSPFGSKMAGQGVRVVRRGCNRGERTNDRVRAYGDGRHLWRNLQMMQGLSPAVERGWSPGAWKRSSERSTGHYQRRLGALVVMI